MLFVVHRLGSEVANGANLVKAEVKKGTLRTVLRDSPRTAPLLRFLERHVDLNAALNGWAQRWRTARR
jgi:hypothetical protein